MYGSFNTTQLKLQSQGQKLEWAITGLNSEGLSEVEGEGNEADSSRLSQLEAAYKSNHAGVFRITVSDKKSDLDDYITAPQDDPNYYSEDRSYHFNWQKKFLKHYFVGVSFQQFHRHAVNQPDSESSKLIDEIYKAQSHQIYLKAKNIKDILDFGLDYFNEVADLPSLELEKSQQHYGAWTKLNFNPFKDHNLNFGLRYYDIKNTQGFVYQSEYMIQLNSLAVWTRLSSGFKAASLSDLYTPSIGNSSLNDEKNTYFELGTSYQTSLSLIKLLYFKNNYKDLIQFKQNEGLLNIGRAKIEGMELSSVSMIGSYQLTAFINYWDSMNLETNKRLTLRPEWVLGLGLERKLASFKYQVQGKYIGHRFDFADNKLAAYIRWDVYLKYQITKNLNSYLNILNAFDANSKWAVGYNSQPRELYIGLSYGF
ncbi:MAG: TonB-dependent receptor [Bdellovibrionales bacterium]|nr:TonB-dependent receptor [Bdellovibrionales bacterium]